MTPEQQRAFIREQERQKAEAARRARRPGTVRPPKPGDQPQPEPTPDPPQYGVLEDPVFDPLPPLPDNLQLMFHPRGPDPSQRERNNPPRVEPCESIFGSPQEGFQWVGSYVTYLDGTVSNTCRLVRIEKEEDEEEEERRRKEQEEAERRQRRLSAREYTLETFQAFGLNSTDLQQLGLLLDQWIMVEGLADLPDGPGIILNRFRKTDIYARRFAGMAELSARNMAISEAEYIQLESSYRNIMANYGLPSTYYDSPEDYARLIGAGLSPNEVEQRVVAAKQAMNPLVAAELREYYNVTDGDLTAYMLGLVDEKGLGLASARNQEEIRQRGRLAQIGAAAERAGFSMTRAQTERLAGTSVGQTIDPFQMQTLSRLESEFNQARRIAERETTLAAIDREAFDQRDALAAAFGDEQARLASERRAKRERARFAGSAGTAAGSLGVERNL